MQVISLQSGSNGNCVYVEAGGVRLLVDAGIPGCQVRQRLALFDRDPLGLHGLLISHDHVDHSRAMGVYQREFGVPLYVTPKTLHAARRRTRLGQIDNVRYFQAGATLRFGPVTVETIPTPHDGADGVGFVIDDGSAAAGGPHRPGARLQRAPRGDRLAGRRAAGEQLRPRACSPAGRIPSRSSGGFAARAGTSRTSRPLSCCWPRRARGSVGVPGPSLRGQQQPGAGPGASTARCCASAGRSAWRRVRAQRGVGSVGLHDPVEPFQGSMDSPNHHPG